MKTLSPKKQLPSDTPGSGSGVIRFTDLPLAIRKEALVIAKTYPGLSLTKAVAAAIEEQHTQRREKYLKAKIKEAII